ncbi:MAG: bifunctional riboflavin kinase/FAD synthetase [Proteobacteria bacterium]|nr:bifunctional riboflavin kinase/FAD synthetase [Pseudomonadota bacterium]
MIKIFEGIENIEKIDNPIIAIGNFDGVHRGHKELIKKVIDESEKNHGNPSVLTFYPHPLTVVNPYTKIEQITPLNDKIKILEDLGITYVFVIKFDDNFSNISAKDFIEKVLVDKIGAKEVVVGYDFSFGKNRKGSVETLKEFGSTYNFKVQVVPPIKEDGKIISSTNIRSFLKEGLIKNANNFLGRPYTIKGIVIKGRKIGRLIGFPTANLLITDYLIPRRGVYAVYAFLDNKKYNALVTIGPSPTFHIETPNFEVHILDFDDNIYGKEITVEFVERIRGIEKFKDVEDLKNQIYEDIKKARLILK